VDQAANDGFGAYIAGIVFEIGGGRGLIQKFAEMWVVPDVIHRLALAIFGARLRPTPQMHTDESTHARQLLVMLFAFPARFEPLLTIKPQLERGRPTLVS
jgi:hypothetical protein